ncbi:MGMT family protein [Hydrogenovibrio halophilus]|uniref:MGMT family protein n=1 Tax=Hydrogenovibrio halophilus TaxID=373391 RepID=UPI000399B3C0|nr:MGMT family protein [Hydrogenovibrio halophilus]
MSTFSQQVYALVARIPPGKVTTYKALAQALDSRAYQAIGQALHRNPTPETVPCHRVVKANGALGGYAWGVSRKKALLESEGVPFLNGHQVDLKTGYFQV